MNTKYKITGKDGLIAEGSISGQTAGPSGIQDTYISPSKFGVIGIHDSADVAYAKSQEIEELLDRYRRIVAKGRSWGRDVASNMLEHWLNGSGSDMKLDCNWLRSHNSITSAENTNNTRFVEKTIAGAISRMKEGQVVEEKEYWDRKLTANILSELYYTSGTSIITSRGLFRLTRNNGWITITGTVEHHWWDPYDWHPGLAAFIPDFGTVEDADAKTLEDAGYAKAFGMYSIWHQNFSGKHGLDKGFAFLDDYKYIWGDVKCGRAPKGTVGEWAADHDAMTDSFNNPLPGLEAETSQPHSASRLNTPTPRRNRRGRERNGWR